MRRPRPGSASASTSSLTTPRDGSMSGSDSKRSPSTASTGSWRQRREGEGTHGETGSAGTALLAEDGLVLHARFVGPDRHDEEVEHAVRVVLEAVGPLREDRLERPAEDDRERIATTWRRRTLSRTKRCRSR